MKYTSTDVAGVAIVDIEADRDDRGFFSLSFCTDEFSRYGLFSSVAQTNICYTYTRGTMRGLRRQAPPYAEAMLMRCTAGAFAAVAVDVRPESRTYRKHTMVQLSADNHRALYVPPYVAYGLQTLADNTEVTYQVSSRCTPAAEQGFRWDDPEFGIAWPLPVTAISEKDSSWPLLDPFGSSAA